MTAQLTPFKVVHVTKAWTSTGAMCDFSDAREHLLGVMCGALSDATSE